MNTKTHWEKVYGTKMPEAVSWYRPHLETSIALIKRAGAEPTSSIIDVGAGESTLADDLLSLGYENITALDISEIAVDVCKKRLGATANRVHWLIADVTAADLRFGVYDVWHDRAVFHFLTTDEQRMAYVRNVARSVRRRGHVIVSTFGPEGPSRCSGLDVVRYNAESLHHEFGKSFRLVESSEELHQTPFGTTQQFLYCYCQVG
jgi:2-polyprenyl-3-methyl-5-hydroxy-6-metoxy-1,4-benzoquinol methylase